MFRDDGKQEIWEELRIRENGRGVTNHKQEGGREGRHSNMLMSCHLLIIYKLHLTSSDDGKSATLSPFPRSTSVCL